MFKIRYDGQLWDVSRINRIDAEINGETSLRQCDSASVGLNIHQYRTEDLHSNEVRERAGTRNRHHAVLDAQEMERRDTDDCSDRPAVYTVNKLIVLCLSANTCSLGQHSAYSESVS